MSFEELRQTPREFRHTRQLLARFAMKDDAPLPDENFGILGPTPTIKGLRYLMQYGRIRFGKQFLIAEYGIYKHNGDWYYLQGEVNGIYLDHLPINSPAIIHTHPFSKSGLPSTRDFVVHHRKRFTGNSFIVSDLGVTQFWQLHLDVKQSKDDLERYQALYLFHDEANQRFPRISDSEYAAFMHDHGCQWQIHTWEEIGNDQNLLTLLDPTATS